eukprot:TRINITY_DN67929_c0_g1_i1.p1 TRINITY_DN67929_c0_g1~~TRINITY_DN67929_c0_g1_i1.p1  ORF type:complete len:183 (-),score=21.17 TRINITY_DN67929_c0_g1_i1:381-929(-)
MTSEFRLTDQFFVDSIDAGVTASNRYEHVSRVEFKHVHHKDTQLSVLLDTNIDFFPVQKNAVVEVCITTTLHRDARTRLPTQPETYDPSLATAKNSLVPDYDYVICGQLYHTSTPAENLRGLYVSFGGMLCYIEGLDDALKDLVACLRRPPETLFMLLRHASQAPSAANPSSSTFAARSRLV